MPAIWLLLLASSLGAPSAKASLVYEVGAVGAACPDEQWVRSAVSARLGRDPFDATAPMLVKSRIERIGAGPGLRGLVVVERADGTSGRRTLTSPTGDCLELASSLELAITLAIEPLLLARPAPSPVAVAQPLPPAPAPLPSAPSSSVQPDPHWVISGRAGLLGAAGAQPGLTGGLIVGVLARRAVFSTALEARVHLPTPLDSSGTVQAFTGLASLVPCAHWRALTGCAVFSMGAFQVERQVDVRRVTTFMSLAGVRLGAEIPLVSGLALVPWLEGALLLTRTSVVAGPMTLWVSWPFAISGGASLQFEFSS